MAGNCSTGKLHGPYHRNGHGALRWYFSGEKSISEIRDFQRKRAYPGNAPVVRAVPIGLLEESQLANWAIINASCTHPHPKAIDSSILVARASRAMLVEKIDSQALIPHCLPFVSDEELLAILQQAEQLPEPDRLQTGDYEVLCGPQPLTEFIPGLHGLSSNAMYTAVSALYFIKHAQNAFEGLKYSICLGGDVDSLASIVTGILAGRYGMGELPQYMLREVEGTDYLQALADDFYEFLTTEHHLFHE